MHGESTAHAAADVLLGGAKADARRVPAPACGSKAKEHSAVAGDADAVCRRAACERAEVRHGREPADRPHGYLLQGQAQGGAFAERALPQAEAVCGPQADIQRAGVRHIARAPAGPQPHLGVHEAAVRRGACGTGQGVPSQPAPPVCQNIL